MPGSMRPGCGRSQLRCQGEQSGAAEACWAHNPEVDGSKPSSANCFFLLLPLPATFHLHCSGSLRGHAHGPPAPSAPSLCHRRLLSPLPSYEPALPKGPSPRQTRGSAAAARPPPTRNWGSWGHQCFSLPVRQLNPNFPDASGHLQESAGGEEDKAGATLANTCPINLTISGFSPS